MDFIMDIFISDLNVTQIQMYWSCNWTEMLNLKNPTEYNESIVKMCGIIL